MSKNNQQSTISYQLSVEIIPRPPPPVMLLCNTIQIVKPGARPSRAQQLPNGPNRSKSLKLVGFIRSIFLLSKTVKDRQKLSKSMVYAECPKIGPDPPVSFARQTRQLPVHKLFSPWERFSLSALALGYREANGERAAPPLVALERSAGLR